MIDKPLISVITINYNDGHKIEDTIKSVVEQDYKLIEYIVVDGGSSDQSLDVIKKYSDKIKIIISEPDNGLYDAMNKGISKATGEWVIFINSGDCFYNLSALSMVFSVNRNECNVIYGDSEIRYNNFTTIKYALKDQRKLWKGMIYCHQSMLTRRKLLNDNSFEQHSFHISADYNFIYKLAQKEHFCYCGLLISSIEAGGLSDTRRLKAIMESYKVIKLNGDRQISHTLYYFYLILDALFRLTLKKILPKKIVSIIIKLKFRVTARR